MVKLFSRWTPVCAVFLLLALALYYYLPPAYFLYTVRADSKNRPELWQTPQPLMVESRVRGDTNKQISFHGVRFSTNWGDEKILRDFKKGGLLTFGESRAILFLGIAQEPTNYRTLSLEHGGNARMKTLVGETAMQSNYVLEREVLNMSPREMNFSLNRMRMVQRAMLLSAKWVSATKGETGIYQFQTDKVRGFQMGNPEKTGVAVLHIYDPNDRLTTVILSTNAKAATRLTQDEVDVFIASLNIDQLAPDQSATGK